MDERMRARTAAEGAAVEACRQIVEAVEGAVEGAVTVTVDQLAEALAVLAVAAGERGRDVWAIARPSYAEREAERVRLVALMREELLRVVDD